MNRLVCVCISIAITCLYSVNTATASLVDELVGCNDSRPATGDDDLPCFGGGSDDNLAASPSDSRQAPQAAGSENEAPARSADRAGALTNVPVGQARKQVFLPSTGFGWVMGTFLRCLN